jgi:PAS domain S-box-containing protein
MSNGYDYLAKKDEDKNSVELIVELKALRKTNSRLKDVIARRERLEKFKKQSPNDTFEELEIQRELVNSLRDEIKGHQAERDTFGEELDIQVEELRAANEELLKAAELLKESEERFRILADNTPHLAWMAEQDGRIFWFNKQWYDYTGTMLEEMRGWGWLKVHHPDYVQKVNDGWRSSIEAGRQHENTALLRGKDGNYRWFLTRAMPVRDKQGNIKLWLGTNTDITEHKCLEEKLALSASFPEMNPIPIFEVNEAGVITYSNPATNRLFPDLQAMGFSHTILKGIAPNVFKKDGMSELTRDVHINGTTYQQYIYYLPDRNTFRVYSRDITERKRAEEALIEAKRQAELYVDLMSHDIRNMNHSAMGYLELALQALEMEKRLKLDDKVLIERPMHALENSSALIDNVRKLQKLMTEGVKTKPTDLHKIFRELEATSFHSDDRDILINIQHVPGVMVEANDLLKDVFVNLITNAIKHSDEEKQLTVSVKVEPVDKNGKKYYRCVVEDNGPGIPDEMKGKLFHRFQRGTTKARGKGLGLYLVRTLVEGYDGKVWVEDRVQGDYQKGSRFVVMLPAVKQ